MRRKSSPSDPSEFKDYPPVQGFDPQVQELLHAARLQLIEALRIPAEYLDEPRPFASKLFYRSEPIMARLMSPKQKPQPDKTKHLP